MSYILNIETATPTCSVALSKDGKLIDCIENYQGQTHAEQLTVFIEQILKQNQLKTSHLSAIAVSSGPGSYTGLRIGVSAAKGICYGCQIPLIEIPTLKAMAWEVANSKKYPNALFCPMIDARRMEVYSAIFDSNLKSVESTHAKIIDSNAYQNILSEHQLIFFGTGAEKCKDTILHPNAVFLEHWHISAQNMSELAYQKYLSSDFVDVAYFEPFYLKEYQAVKSTKNLLT